MGGGLWGEILWACDYHARLIWLQSSFRICTENAISQRVVDSKNVRHTAVYEFVTFVNAGTLDTTITVAEEPGGFGLCATGLEYRVVIRGARVP